jgi:hypothetical protein
MIDSAGQNPAPKLIALGCDTRMVDQYPNVG